MGKTERKCPNDPAPSKGQGQPSKHFPTLQCGRAHTHQSGSPRKRTRHDTHREDRRLPVGTGSLLGRRRSPKIWGARSFDVQGLEKTERFPPSPCPCRPSAGWTRPVSALLSLPTEPQTHLETPSPHTSQSCLTSHLDTLQAGQVDT